MFCAVIYQNDYFLMKVSNKLKQKRNVKMMHIMILHLSPVTRKAVSGVFDQVRLKPAC